MVDFLTNRMPGARLFVMGEQPLCDDLAGAGFELVEDPRQVEAVIASFDRTFVYRKLQIAFDALRRGARFFATNPRPLLPGARRRRTGLRRDHRRYRGLHGLQVEAVVGKPSRYMIEAALNLMRLPAEDCLMTGDRLETDVRMGLEAGMSAALILTGATPESALAATSVQPTYILRHLDEIIPLVSTLQ